MADEAARRTRMVTEQIADRGIRSQLVLDAMLTVPRHRFVQPGTEHWAYHDTPLDIGEEQTISQPYMVAIMADALGLQGGETVLEVGTGSGYAAAVLAEIASEVYTIERLAPLAERAAKTLDALGYDTVRVRCADGTLGWPEHAPFDGIVVSAGGPEVPDALEHQLAIGGRMVIPVGVDTAHQQLVRVTRVGPDAWETERLMAVRFVPLVGEQGWSPP